MKPTLRLGIVLLLLTASAAPLHAQVSPEAEVRSVVEALFDGMRRGDSTAVRAVFHPEARLLTSAIRDAVPALQEGSVDEFVRAVGSPHEQAWDERIDGLEIRVDDPLATAWMNYRFHLGEGFSHCGVNAFQFIRTAEGWRVIQITDTRRRICTH